MNLSRRKFFGILAAPAIVRASSLMPLSVRRDPMPPVVSFVTTKIFNSRGLQWGDVVTIPLDGWPFLQEFRVKEIVIS